MLKAIRDKLETEPSVISAVCSDTHLRNKTMPNRQVHWHKRQTWKQIFHFETNECESDMFYLFYFVIVGQVKTFQKQN